MVQAHLRVAQLVVALGHVRLGQGLGACVSRLPREGGALHQQREPAGRIAVQRLVESQARPGHGFFAGRAGALGDLDRLVPEPRRPGGIRGILADRSEQQERERQGPILIDRPPARHCTLELGRRLGDGFGARVGQQHRGPRQGGVGRGELAVALRRRAALRETDRVGPRARGLVR
jgi:hypothetical protein